MASLVGSSTFKCAKCILFCHQELQCFCSYDTILKECKRKLLSPPDLVSL